MLLLSTQGSQGITKKLPVLLLVVTLILVGNIWLHPKAAFFPVSIGATASLGDWAIPPGNVNCLLEWRSEKDIQVWNAKFSDWDHHYRHQSMCPIYQTPRTGYMFHMLWDGPFEPFMVKPMRLTIDAWLVTQRMGDGHKLVFWYTDLVPAPLKAPYDDYNSLVEFRFYDPRAEAAGTCLSSMPEFSDQEYQLSNKVGKESLSDLSRVLLLYKYGGVWIDSDAIPMRDFTPLLRVGPFAPAFKLASWNNVVLFFGPPRSVVAANVLATACTMSYDKPTFDRTYRNVTPSAWYWLYNDGLLQVCDKHTHCGVQRLPIEFFDGRVPGWAEPPQKTITLLDTEADNHSLTDGQPVPSAFQQVWVWHARGAKDSQISYEDLETGYGVIRSRLDYLLRLGPSKMGRDIFPGPAFIHH